MENAAVESSEVSRQTVQKPFVSTALVVFIMILLSVFSYFVGYKRAEIKNMQSATVVLPSPPLERVCTMDAKICPDGSSVGRTGPNCEFSACPASSSSEGESESITTLPISGSFQDLFKKVCPTGGERPTVASLPIVLDPSLNAQPMAQCVSDGTDPSRATGYLLIQLPNMRQLVMYDDQSLEPPGDGTPKIGSVGEVFEETTPTKLSAFIPFNNGPAIIGELPFWVRGTKSFATQTGQFVYLNTDLEAIAKDDSRLQVFWKPFGEKVKDENFPQDLREVTFTQSNGLFLRTVENFFKPVTANTSESRAVEQVKNELKMVRAK